METLIDDKEKYSPVCLKITNLSSNIQKVKLLGAKINKDAVNFNNPEGIIIENGYLKMPKKIPFPDGCMLSYGQILKAICDTPFHCSNVMFYDYDDYEQIYEMDKNRSFLIDGKLPSPHYFDHGPFNGMCGMKYIPFYYGIIPEHTPYNFPITQDTEITFPIRPQKNGNAITVYLFPPQGMPFLFGVDRI